MARNPREEIANYLLNNCFLIGTEDSMRERYYYVLNHEAEFQEVFSPIGYTLIINRSLRVIQLINSYGTGRVAFKKYESIMLLILRLLYMEKREKLTTNTDKVMVSVGEIRQEYEKLNLPRKFDQTLLEDSLSQIKKYNLASVIGRLETSDSKIQVYPSVMLALTDQGISAGYDQVKDLLQQYESTPEEDA